jgi:hypothetical protein
MADSPPYPGAPRWVKVFGIIVVGLTLLVVLTRLAGGGHGGHGGHAGSWGHAPPEGSHTQPARHTPAEKDLPVVGHSPPMEGH